MSKFDYPSKYYADDKDITDLLSEKKFNQKAILQIARRRGILLSSKMEREELIQFVSKLPFSLSELLDLIHKIETEEKENHTTPLEIITKADMDELVTVVKQVQQLRGPRNSEVYNINYVTDSVSMHVKYSELDHRSTRVLQWTDHNLEILIKKSKAGFNVRYSETDRAKEIIDSITKLLPEKDNGATLTRTISLAKISDCKKRTKFFTNLIYGIEGLRPENVKDLRLNRITDTGGTSKIETQELAIEEIDEKEEVEIEEAPSANVKRTVLTGDSLLQAKEFHDFCEKGFFISRALWTSTEKEGTARMFEFDAEFKNPDTSGQFTYRIKGVWYRDEDGNLELSRSAVTTEDRNQLRDKIEQAANAALAELTKEETVNESSEPIVEPGPPVNETLNQ